MGEEHDAEMNQLLLEAQKAWVGERRALEEQHSAEFSHAWNAWAEERRSLEVERDERLCELQTEMGMHVMQPEERRDHFLPSGDESSFAGCCWLHKKK